MIKKVVTYEDYNGVERSEELWFNLTKTELQKLNFRHHGTYADQLQSIAMAKDIKVVAALFDEIIKSAYGIKSEDGRHFRKSPEIVDDFVSSAVYDALMIELLEDEEKAAALFIGALPRDMQEDVKAEIAKEKEGRHNV